MLACALPLLSKVSPYLAILKHFAATPSTTPARFVKMPCSLPTCAVTCLVQSPFAPLGLAYPVTATRTKLPYPTLRGAKLFAIKSCMSRIFLSSALPLYPSCRPTTFSSHLTHWLLIPSRGTALRPTHLLANNRCRLPRPPPQLIIMCHRTPNQLHRLLSRLAQYSFHI